MTDRGVHVGVASVLAAGIIWGFLGIFVRSLSDYGFTPIQMTCLRYIIVSVFLGSVILCINPKMLRIDRRSACVFLMMGLFGSALNSICYFQSMKMISIGLATILQYISPFIVVLFSAPLFKERLTSEKCVALLFAFLGCVLCTGVLTDFGSVNMMGIFFGIMSGLFYSVYTLGSKASSHRFGILTITFYSSLFSGMLLLPFSDIGSATEIMASSSDATLVMLGLAFFMTLLPFALYNIGVSKMDAGKASIITYVEPLASTIVGFYVYNEAVTVPTAIGVALILLSLILINHKPSSIQHK